VKIKEMVAGKVDLLGEGHTKKKFDFGTGGHRCEGYFNTKKNIKFSETASELGDLRWQHSLNS
jgi:hypothetical protein